MKLLKDAEDREEKMKRDLNLYRTAATEADRQLVALTSRLCFFFGLFGEYVV